MGANNLDIIRWLDKNIEKVLLCIFLGVMVVVMSVQVVARYVFNSSLSWSEELTRYLFIWSAFLSLPFTIRYGIALKIDHFLILLSKNAKRIVNIIGHILMLVFFIFMLLQSLDVVQSAINSGQKSPALGLPMYIVQVSSTVGFTLAIIRTVQSLINYFKNVQEA